MTRKTFLASIVSLAALALNPGAFVAEFRRLCAPRPKFIPFDFHLGKYYGPRIGDTITVRRPMRYVESQNRVDYLPRFDVHIGSVRVAA